MSKPPFRHPRSTPLRTQKAPPLRRARSTFKQVAFLGFVILIILGADWFFLQDRNTLPWPLSRASNSFAQAPAAVPAGHVADAHETNAINLQNLVTLRQTALAQEQAGSPAAVEQWEIIAMTSDYLADRISLLRAALHFTDLPVAERVFAGFSAEEKTEARVIRLGARLALAQGEPPLARATLVQSLAQNPDDDQCKLALAEFDLRSANEADYAAAKTQLEVFVLNGFFRQAALRALLADAFLRHQTADAVRWADLLAGDREATFEDHIQLLNARRIHLGTVPVADVEAIAARAKTTDDYAQLAQWFILTRQPQAALDLIATLDPARRQAAAIRGAEADAFADLQRWPELLNAITEGAWGALPPKLIPYIHAAQTVREHHPLTTGDANLWNEALALASDHPAALRVLLRLAALWDWPEEKNAALRALAATSPDGNWALAQLVATARVQGDTAGVRDAHALGMKLHPENRHIVNDWAYASLLLSPAAVPEDVQHRLDELVIIDPTNPRITATRSLALWRAGSPEAALALLVTLPPEQRQQPTAALLLGALFRATGRAQEAAPYLSLVTPETLLPEEAALLHSPVNPPSGSPSSLVSHATVQAANATL